MIAVLDPLPSISMHVVDPESVGLFLPTRCVLWPELLPYQAYSPSLDASPRGPRFRRARHIPIRPQ
jgi:hypothetical protein